MEAMLFLAYTLLFVFLIGKHSWFRSSGLPIRLLWGIFLLKVAAGSVLAVLYARDRANADIFKFFDDSAVLHGALRSNPSHYLQLLTGVYTAPEALQPYISSMKWWNTVLYSDSYNESRFMIRFNAALRLISFGYYSIHMLVICLLSFAGSTALYKTFIRIQPSARLGCLLAAYLIPSLVFWTSGVLKEGIVLFLLGFFLLIMTDTPVPRLKSILWLLGLVFLLLFVRAYVVLCLAPCVMAYSLARRFPSRAGFLFIAINLVFLLALFNLYRIDPRWDFTHILCYKRGEYIYLAERLGTGSLIVHNYLDFHWYSILAELPKALGNVIFRPHLMEIRSPLYVLPALENTCLLLLAAACLLQSKKPGHKAFFYFSINFTLLLLALTGLTTPVLGSLVRYRTLGLPLLVFILVQASDEQALTSRLKSWYGRLGRLAPKVP